MGIRVFLRKRVTFLNHSNKLKQEHIYRQLKLDRDKALHRINSVLENRFGKKYNENFGMWSEHLLLLAAISQQETSKDIFSILEIGTFRAETTLILSDLFPQSKITTIDLPDSVLKQSSIYSYEFDDIDKAVERNRNLNISNATFYEINSLNLFRLTEKHDLVWMDGDHKKPTVIIDLLNSLNSINSSGVILCDDVITGFIFNRNTSNELAKYLQFLERNKIIEYSLIPKRIGTYNQLFRRKYVALIKLTPAGF